MNPDSITLRIVLGSLAFGPAVLAQDDAPLNPRLKAPLSDNPKEARWQIQAGPQVGFNMSVDLRKARPIPPGPGAGSAIAREYDDGFVGVDSSGNAGGRTWFWGYQNNSQYDPSGAGTINMHHVSHSQHNSESGNSTPQPGFEISISRDLLQLGPGRLGLDFGSGYTRLNFEEDYSGNSTVTVVTDGFNLGGTVPPSAPYRGPFAGPGPLIDAEPFSRATTVEPGTVEGDYQLTGHLFGLRLGPFYEFPIKKLTVRVGAGVGVALVNTEFESDETVTTSSSGNIRTKEKLSETEILYGPQAGLKLAYPLSDQWSIFGGMQYYGWGKVDHSGASMKASLNLKTSLFLQAGMGWTF